MQLRITASQPVRPGGYYAHYSTGSGRYCWMAVPEAPADVPGAMHIAGLTPD
jgi:hypothetical protein